MDLPAIYDQLILAASAAMATAVALFSWRRRPAAAAASLSLLMSGVAIWSLCDLLQILSPDFQTKLFWSKASYLGIVLVPAAFLVFVLQYTGRDRHLTRRNTGLLCIVPIATLILAFTNEYHGLLWSDINRRYMGPIMNIGTVYGPWFWVNAAYSYLLLLTGICLLAKFMLQSPPPYRQQAQVLLAGASIPFICNVLYLARLSPLTDIDLTSFAFSLSGVVLTWGLFCFGLLDLVPVAQEAVFLSMKDGVMVLDPQHRVANCNPAAQRMIGLHGTGIIGLPVTQAKKEFAGRVEGYLDRNEAEAEIELHDPDRHDSRFFDLVISPLLDRKGRFMGRTMVLRDITDKKQALAELKTAQGELERKVEERTSQLTAANRSLKSEILEHERTERALQKSERSYRLLAENATDVIWTMDMEGRFTYVSPSTVRMNGYSAEEAMALTLDRILTPSSLEAVNKALREARETEELPAKDLFRSRTLEVEGRHKDGHLFWAEIKTNLLRDQEGRAVGILGVTRDITERKRAEERLRESEERYRTIFEISPGVIFTLSTEDGTISSLNPAFEKLTGWSRSDWMDRPFAGLIHPGDLPLAREMFQKTLRGEDAPPHELRCLCKSGEYIIGEFTGIPQIEGGRVVREFGFAQDITGKKRAEEALKKARDELETRVEERTAELEAKNAEMERFIYTVSHDLRSPLVTIQGFLDFLTKDTEQMDEENIKADLLMISVAVTKMDALLSETLELSRIGRVANPPQVVPFAEIVQEAIAQTGEKIRSERIEVSVAADLPSVYVDRMRIVEALVNLIENSIKYRGVQLHPRIEIGFRQDGKEPVFFVRDNGMGIDPGQKDKVFELFYKVDKRSEGTGAGLAIVKRIIEVHGGRIWVESELGKGCTVCFTLSP